MQSFSSSLQVVGVLRLRVASLVEQLACDIGVQSAGENKAVEEVNWDPNEEERDHQWYLAEHCGDDSEEEWDCECGDAGDTSAKPFECIVFSSAVIVNKR